MQQESSRNQRITDQENELKDRILDLEKIELEIERKRNKLEFKIETFEREKSLFYMQNENLENQHREQNQIAQMQKRQRLIYETRFEEFLEEKRDMQLK